MNANHPETISAKTYFSLPTLDLSIKSLLTSYLLLIGLGSVLASLQILMTHGMADGEFGLSIDDIVYSYHGNPAHSQLETKLNGSMKDKAPPETRLQIIKWAQNGASEEQWNSEIKFLFEKNCIKCHGVIPGLPNFTRFEAVQKVAKPGNSATVSSLTRSSHIHLFGISFIFLLNGLIFSMSVGIKQWLKISLMCLPFLFLAIDVMSWWLTKVVPNFAWFTILSGVGYSFCSAIILMVSLYQMWILPKSK